MILENQAIQSSQPDILQQHTSKYLTICNF